MGQLSSSERYEIWTDIIDVNGVLGDNPQNISEIHSKDVLIKVNIKINGIHKDFNITTAKDKKKFLWSVLERYSSINFYDPIDAVENHTKGKPKGMSSKPKPENWPIVQRENLILTYTDKITKAETWSRFIRINNNTLSTTIAGVESYIALIDNDQTITLIPNNNTASLHNRQSTPDRQVGQHSKSGTPDRQVGQHSKSGTPDRQVGQYSKSGTPDRQVGQHSKSGTPDRQVGQYSKSGTPDRQVGQYSKSGTPDRQVGQYSKSGTPDRQVGQHQFQQRPLPLPLQLHQLQPQSVSQQFFQNNISQNNASQHYSKSLLSSPQTVVKQIIRQPNIANVMDNHLQQYGNYSKLVSNQLIDDDLDKFINQVDKLPTNSYFDQSYHPHLLSHNLSSMTGMTR